MVTLMVQREQVPLHACQDMIQLLGRGYCGGLRQECGLVAGTMAGYLLLEVELCSEPQGREPHASWGQTNEAQTSWADPPVQGQRKAQEAQASLRARGTWEGWDMASSRWGWLRTSQSAASWACRVRSCFYSGRRPQRRCWVGEQIWAELCL